MLLLPLWLSLAVSVAQVSPCFAVVAFVNFPPTLPRRNPLPSPLRSTPLPLPATPHSTPLNSNPSGLGGGRDGGGGAGGAGGGLGGGDSDGRGGGIVGGGGGGGGSGSNRVGRGSLADTDEIRARSLSPYSHPRRGAGNAAGSIEAGAPEAAVAKRDRGPTLAMHRAGLGAHLLLPAVSVGAAWLLDLFIRFLENSLEYTAKHHIISGEFWCVGGGGWGRGGGGGVTGLSFRWVWTDMRERGLLQVMAPPPTPRVVAPSAPFRLRTVSPLSQC